MASKKKIAKRKTVPAKAKVVKVSPKKKSAVAKLSRRKPAVPAVAEPVAMLLAAPPVVISYELVALRAFQIWQRKIHTNYPEHNWREAEAEIRAELLGTKK